MLYDPTRHEPLTAARWDEAVARCRVQVIVDDVCGQFDPATLWPTHRCERETDRAAIPHPMLYNGAAGVVWALQRLRDQGTARVGLDLEPIVAGLHEHSCHWTTANKSCSKTSFAEDARSASRVIRCAGR